MASFSGISMLPNIEPGQALEFVCGEVAAPGDVVLVLHRGQVVVHRVLAVKGPWILTRGDANPLPDNPIPMNCLIGIAAGVASYSETFIQRMNRTLTGSLFSTAPFLARLAIPFLWRLLWIVRALRAGRSLR